MQDAPGQSKSAVKGRGPTNDHEVIDLMSDDEDEEDGKVAKVDSL